MPVFLVRLVMLVVVPSVIPLVVWLDIRVSLTWPPLSPLS